MNAPTVDGQGLAEVLPLVWRDLARDDAWHTYYGGRAKRFMAYRLGAESPDGVSELPPPSLQSLATVVMYARRDNLLCHLCGGRVSLRITDPLYSRRRASADHLKPRTLGGGDYPSNIRTAHLSCNKARGSRPLLTEPLTEDVVSHSVSEHVLTHDRKGREGKGRESDGRTWGDFSSCRPVSNPRTARLAMMSEAKG